MWEHDTDRLGARLLNVWYYRYPFATRLRGYWVDQPIREALLLPRAEWEALMYPHPDYVKQAIRTFIEPHVKASIQARTPQFSLLEVWQVRIVLWCSSLRCLPFSLNLSLALGMRQIATMLEDHFGSSWRNTVKRHEAVFDLIQGAAPGVHGLQRRAWTDAIITHEAKVRAQIAGLKKVSVVIQGKGKRRAGEQASSSAGNTPFAYDQDGQADVEMKKVPRVVKEKSGRVLISLRGRKSKPLPDPGVKIDADADDQEAPDVALPVPPNTRREVLMDTSALCETDG